MYKLLHTIMALKPMAFLKNALSEGEQASFGRLGAAFVLVNSTAWVWVLILKNHAIPDLSGVTTFAVGGVGTCFGITKAKSVVDAYKGNTQPAADADANKGA